MTANEVLVFNTATSSIFEPGGHPAIDAFKRVVGLEFDGQSMWTGVSTNPSNPGGFERDKVKAIEVEVPAWFAVRVTEYFMQHMVEASEGDANNCHNFAKYILGAGQPIRPALDVVRRGVVGRYPLSIGQRGVVGVKNSMSNRAPHSLIGLGQERNESLQVMAAGGFMGITSYGSVLNFYRRTFAKDADIYTDED